MTQTYTTLSKTLKKKTTIKPKIQCSERGCIYFSGSERYFTSKKLLNQHIAKVHADKKFECGKCKKGFGLDWWRRNHENTCGMQWKCSCGATYSSKETLFTHARRNQHVLPEGISKTKSKKTLKSPLYQPSQVIYLIQPIIQNVTCIQALPTPSPLEPCKLSLPSPDIQPAVESCHNALGSSSLSLLCKPASHFETGNFHDQKGLQKCASTQTYSDGDTSPKTLTSRGSQCSRRKAKKVSQTVVIESTHTQTAESVVGKIKKKRSRRKSVAITTEPPINPHSENRQSLWPDFGDLILPIPDFQAVKSTASTQTSSGKVSSDSQTVFSSAFSRLDGVHTNNRNNLSQICDEILLGMPSDFTLGNVDDDTLSNTFPNNSLLDSQLNSNMVDIDQHISVGSAIATNTNSPCLVFQSAEHSNEKVSHPNLYSDIHTQTINSSMLDFNLLANMETQTIDDFNFYDLEFSDSETQTPWDDLPNIDNSSLSIDQLSMGIQTDFSSFASASSSYDFLSGIDMQGMINEGPGKSVNIETQTCDAIYFPEFAHSESQTLDSISSYIFAPLDS